jgi:hypothetical protein
MPRTCTVCRHNQREAIEQALLAGEPLRNIAKRYGTSATALHRHRHDHLPAALTRANERATEKAEDQLLKFDIAHRGKRLATLDKDHRLLEQVREERAEDMKDVPGGTSGLLTRKIKSIGFGENSREVEEHALDPVMLRERRRIEEQAAKELGQWQEPKAAAGRETLVIMVPAITALPEGPIVDIDIPGRMAPALPPAENEDEVIDQRGDGGNTATNRGVTKE